MGVLILLIIAIYFAILLLIAYLVGRQNTSNDAFFLGNRRSPWYIVSIGMIGASISGVTFVSAPGMVGQFDMTYMQMVIGFFPGYLIVAYLLLPLYYKLNLTSIYAYLAQRFGSYSHKTGASFFILSRVIGSASKLYLVALILQAIVFDQWHIPFYLTVSCLILLIFLYTYRSGIKTILWTDALQSICLLAALILLIWQVGAKLEFDTLDTIKAIHSNPHSRIFVFDDWASKQNFFKQFISGILIVVAMTGLDQDMMQKNLTCKNLKDAQKNMLSYGFSFIPLNLLFLSLGVLLLLFAAQYQIVLPSKSDQLLPLLATQYLGLPVLLLFTIGIIAASFSNADSALTSLTTTICVDLLHIGKQSSKKAQKTRKQVHILVSISFLATILLIDYLGQNNILDTIYKAASYTYGPLLGLFFFGLYTQINVRDKLVPFVCILAPLTSFLLEQFLLQSFAYTVGYEILLFNGLLTALGLWCIAYRKKVFL